MKERAEEQNQRDRALGRLKKKREFATHVAVYVVVNVFLIILWATADDRGFFWPMYPLLGWGVGIVLHGWDVYRGGPTEEQIRKEIDRVG